MFNQFIHNMLLHWANWNHMLSDVPLWNPHGAIISLITLAAGVFLLGRYMWVTAVKR